MKVFKFGGASINSVERIKGVAEIIRSFDKENKLIVISAMGKTTNALEKVVEAFYRGEQSTALKLFEQIKESHLTVAKYLLVTYYNHAYAQMLNFFTEIEWLLHDKPVRQFDYYYDQVVCIGELLSTVIVHAYLLESGIEGKWIDVRDIFRTDDNFRDATIDWSFTQQRVDEEIVPLFGESSLVITQGFIGATSENESTTLGREGSDYSAALFANMLNAKDLTIWKDVEGVMNADPKVFPAATVIPELNYEEIIEMAYYGAQVIHPKTIKPLQNKHIPLHVKCFLDPKIAGTIIHDSTIKNLPPIIILKNKQVLIKLQTKDFSFVGEKPIALLYQLMADHKLKPNLVQTGAVQISLCMDESSEKLDHLAFAATEIFEVSIEKDLVLLTIRHFNNKLLEELTTGKYIELVQQSPETYQALMR
jgi:aspartate kinase